MLADDIDFKCEDSLPVLPDEILKLLPLQLGNRVLALRFLLIPRRGYRQRHRPRFIPVVLGHCDHVIIIRDHRRLGLLKKKEMEI